MKGNILIITMLILATILPLNHAFNIVSNNLSTPPQKAKIEPKIEQIYNKSPLEDNIVSEPSRGETRANVPILSDSAVKTYMDYKMITDTSSPQHQFIYNSGEVYIADDGFIRTLDNQYIGVALGSYFGDIGTRYVFTLDTGVELKIIKIEEKADIHTCDNNYMQKYDGSIIEFVVDSNKMNYARGENSLLYNGNFNNNEWLKGNIIKIEKVIDMEN